eukprot:TRINITY_DN101_c0_g1_i3.p2 TRINITY_DN101_c0_g1~~TRINITY_DN101_c0_g1_i3.p2  ORF type:complete len:169 (+),score=57.66 TRINITY_DN101_c0_g1_i3:106-612(+)
MIRRPPRSTQSRSSAASDVYKRQGESQEDLLLGQVESRAAFRIADDDAVKAEFHFDDVGDTVLGAELDFGRFDPARSVGDVGMLDAHTGAEQLQAATGTGAFDDRRLEAAGLAERFSNGRGEREYSRGSDDADLVTGFRSRCNSDNAGEGERDSLDDGFPKHDFASGT